MAHSLLLTIITLIGAPLLAAAPVVTDAPAAQTPGTHMVLIPAGNFQMGKDGIATPVHTVFVSAFYMAKYEVTKELWNSVRAWGMAERRGYTDLGTGNGSYAFKGENHPVHSITWYDMVKWCNARSEMENLTPCYTV
jgi:formylglycine-generating enzyme required for sulfatase activity